MEALHPSIDQVEGPGLVSNEVLMSKVEYTNINYHLGAIYLGCTMDRERQIREGVARLIPQSRPKQIKEGYQWSR